MNSKGYRAGIPIQESITVKGTPSMLETCMSTFVYFGQHIRFSMTVIMCKNISKVPGIIFNVYLRI